MSIVGLVAAVAPARRGLPVQRNIFLNCPATLWNARA